MSEAESDSGAEAKTTEPTVAGEPSREEFIRKCFVGRGGIRAGWRLIIFLVIAAALLTGMTFLAWVFGQGTAAVTTLEARTLFSNEAVAFLIVLCASWIMSRIEHRKIADYGLPLQRAFGRQFWQGVVMGFAAITVLLASMRMAGVFRFGTIGLGGSETYKYAVLWGAGFLCVGLFEEYFFRGYPLFTLTTGMTFWPSAILLSAFFGFIHHTNPGESWVGALETGATGLLFCVMLRGTGNLWMPIGFHAAWDWGETYFYGVPDSGLVAKGHLFNPTFAGPAWLTGGSVGPEGSWLCIALLAILLIVFRLWLREKKYPNPEAIRFPREAGSVEARS